MTQSQIHAAACMAVLLMVCGSVAHAAESPREVYFGTDVVPILTKLGCNGGGCHGKATGQNGFKLSLFGFEPEVDYDSLVTDARGRRLSLADPDRSLLLLKATSRMPHGGGRRLDESSDDYRILRDWIAQGATAPRSDDPRLVRIELSPREQVLETNASQQLRVTAFFSNDTSREVTRQSVYQSNEPDIASVDADGLVKTGSQYGLVSVMARFGEQIATFHAAVPFASDPAKMAAAQSQLDQVESKLGSSPFDRLLLHQWRRLGVVPSAPADDATFLRRVTIDICGTLPTSDEVSQYLADTRTDKRSRLIDRLLERPEYASYFALKWADILQNRGTGYGTSKQRASTTLFAAWIRDSLAANKPYDQFASEILTATGSQYENAPTLWYRHVRKSPEYVEAISQAFLGVRVQCAQCHHHPTERWSQSDYYGLAAVFARVGRKGGFADAEVPTNETIFVKADGDVLHPRTGEVMRPRPLGGAEFQLARFDDPRREFVRWMTASDNPFFARTMVNRMWGHFLGRGIIHPIDDARSTNPPSNPELLDALARDFIGSGYDVKHLIRVIANSAAYSLSSTPVEQAASLPENYRHAGSVPHDDRQSFSRFYPRRLKAEVLLDGISQILEVPTQFAGGPGQFPLGTRAIDLPDENVPSTFLDIFGRPARSTACECERTDDPALGQALELVNSKEFQRKLTDKTGYIEKLATNKSLPDQNVRDIFLRVLSRPPESSELKTALEFLESEPDRAEAYRSLMWSLLATNEFLFNR